MLNHSWLPKLAAVALSGTMIGCGILPHRAEVRTTPPPPPPPAPAAVTAAAQKPAPVAAPADPVQAVLDESQRIYDQGKRDLDLGHLEQAKNEFNRAIDVLLNAPSGARMEPRLRAQFDRLVDRISALEVAALATGDGFSEKPAEPASIDELLALSDSSDTRTAPTPAVTAAVQTDLAQNEHDVPIPMNDRVLGYVAAFQGRLRPFIQDGLERGSQYLPMIQNVFRAEGLPLDLAYVPLIESAFKPNALSRANARGVWQFVHATAVENGLRHDWYIDERSDPEKATHAAAKYLKSLSRQFDGDWHLALASYNGGPGRVLRAMKRTGRDDFWDLSTARKTLPRETREYVPMILAAMIIARNPAQYGFTFESSAPLAHDCVSVTGPLDLRRVAEWTGTPVDVIQQLNPELRRWTTPVRGAAYQLKVPAGKAEEVRSRLEALPASERAALNWHTVKSGETLLSISRKLRVSRTDLAEANYLSVRSRVRPGEKLIIPLAPTTLMASQPERTTPTAADSHPVVERVALVTSSGSSDNVRHFYRVRRGDTLSSIARSFETSVNSLKQWNRLRGNQISPGQRLTVFTRSDQ
jgi:membrane-bound lytic murein transglycosylase D